MIILHAATLKCVMEVIRMLRRSGRSTTHR